MLLKFLRKKKNMKRIMWALAILIIPAFVIWGSGSTARRGEESPNYAGKLFNRKVPFEEYLDMWRVTRDYATRTFGVNIPPEFIDALAWNRLILLDASKREKIAVKDSEILEKIVSLPIFQRDGSFDKKLYQSMLGESAKGFEEKLRDDIRISKLREKVTSSVSLSDEEVKEEYVKKFEKIKASYVSIPFSGSEKGIQYMEADLAGFYEKNKESFRKPEQVNVNYIEVLLSGFTKVVSITDGEIERYFEEHLADFKEPDSEEAPVLNDLRKKDISVLLALEKKQSLAEEQAYKVLDKALEKKNLDEAGHAFDLKVKETGFFSIQEEIPGIGWSQEFKNASFQLKTKEISSVLVRTDEGFYIIQPIEKKESYIPDFSEARELVIKNYKKDMSAKLAEKKAKKLLSSMKNKMKNGKGFVDAASELTLEAKETDFITRDGYVAGIGPARGFFEASLSLKNEEITGPIKMPESWIILKIDEYQGIDEAKFSEEKEGFQEKLLSRKKDALFSKWFEELKEQANFVSYTLTK